MMVRDCTDNDIAAMCEIYNFYVENSLCTFEETVINETEMQSRVSATTLSYPWLVCEEDGVVRGYAYATAWKSRSAYRNSAEVTVYVNPQQMGKGFGKALYQTLESKLTQQNRHALLAGIALPNPASIALHEKLGFEKVAHLKQVGFKLGKWVDVGYWQKIL